MPNSLFVPSLIAGMIITGSSNSLWSKWQDMQCVENCQHSDPRRHVLYEQPVWQTLQMFLGEMLCFLPVIYAAIRARSKQPIQLPIASESEDDLDHSNLKLKQQHLSGYKVLLLWLPAACDLTGTTLMNVGLLYTPVSIYQMTRGALVLFVGILSVLFLHRRLWLYQWLSLVTVMAGVSIVGLSGSMIKDVVKEDLLGLLRQFQSGPLTATADLPPSEPIDLPQQASKVVVGVFFILFAQIFTAAQFVIEEKILSRYSVEPLVAVGFEGLFGAISILLCMPLLAQYSDRSSFFDLPRGWHQMIDNPPVLYSGIAIAISISLFNFFGLSVTRYVSATSRSLTDTCRTLSIWVISLALGWEKLLFPISLLQVLGFSLLVYGTFLFNNLVTPPKFLQQAHSGADDASAPSATGGGNRSGDDSERALLAEESLEETAALPADLGTSGYDVVPTNMLHHRPAEQQGQQRPAT